MLEKYIQVMTMRSVMHHMELFRCVAVVPKFSKKQFILKNILGESFQWASSCSPEKFFKYIEFKRHKDYVSDQQISKAKSF